MKTTDFREYLNQKLQNPDTQREYDALEPEYALIEQILDLREKAGLTQAQLAERVGTPQCNISRLENGNYNPSLAFLKRMAKGLGKKLVITFQ